MTAALQPTDDPDELRKRWLNRYLAVQSKTDTKFRTALIGAAEQAYSQVIALDSSKTFSAGVRSAQLKLVMQQVQAVHSDLFKKLLPIIADGQRSSATASVIAFGETDRTYLERAFANSPTDRSRSVDAYLASQKQTAAAGVVHAISRITNSDQPLSARVYRTRYLANTWVKNQLNVALLKNASAKEIALKIRSSIRPNVAGGVSYAALRLGRTELNNAFHATTITLAQNRPWVTGMDWNLSTTHENSTKQLAEICEVYSHQTFTVENVPAKPHPQCRCYATPKVEPMGVFLTHLTAGQYRDWMKENVA